MDQYDVEAETVETKKSHLQQQIARCNSSDATTPLSPTLKNLQSQNRTADIAAKFGGAKKSKAKPPPVPTKTAQTTTTTATTTTIATATTTNAMTSKPDMKNNKNNKSKLSNKLTMLNISGPRQISKSVPTTPVDSTSKTGLTRKKKSNSYVSKSPQPSNNKRESWRNKKLPTTPIDKRPLPRMDANSNKNKDKNGTRKTSLKSEATITTNDKYIDSSLLGFGSNSPQILPSRSPTLSAASSSSTTKPRGKKVSVVL